MNLYQIFLQQLKADKKKAVILSLLAVAMLGLWGRMMLRGPSTAAATPPGGEESVASVSVSADSASGADGAEALLPPVDSSSDLLATLSRLTFAPGRDAVSIEHKAREVNRDLFSTNWNAFAPTAEALSDERKKATSEKAKDDGPSFMSILAQAIKQGAAQNEAVRHSRDSVDEEANALILSGVLLGPTIYAHINGHWLKSGDMIAGFTVVEIDSTHVVLRKSGSNVRLTMP